MKISRRRAVELMMLSPWVASAQVNVEQPKKKLPRDGRVDSSQFGGQKNQTNPKKASTFYTEVPAHDFDIILGRPTKNAITASVLSYADMEGFIAFGPDPSRLEKKTTPQRFKANEPAEVVLSGLQPNQSYAYRFEWRCVGSSDFVSDGPHYFHTPRSRGNGFTFTIQADSHLDHPQAPSLYAGTLAAVLSDAPDFHIDLGDTFMTDKRQQQFISAAPQYLSQRYYLGLVGKSAHVFLVLGNHDGEVGLRFYGKSDSMPAWSNTMRKRYFPNPVPDDFYTGNDVRVEPLGLLQDFYAWEWGDALLVVLDPYWFTTSQNKGPAAYWDRSLGAAQYHWLESTLAKSTAPYKFVFIHNLVGGADESMRGGAEAARYFEWGGRNLDGTLEFAQHRPGWTAPIHEVLKRHHVNAVFHGHDHFFARQELDGIVYQLVPQPATPGGRDVTRMASEYGYVTGDFLPSPGYMRVSVGDTEAKIAYINTGSAQPTLAREYRVAPNHVTLKDSAKK